VERNIFADPAAGLKAYDLTLPGDSGQRNGLRGDGYFTIDVGLGKRFILFSVKDHPHTLQIRAEAFNVFNHTQWAGINSAMTCYGGPLNSAADPGCLASSNFLHPNSAHRARILQFGLKFIF